MLSVDEALTQLRSSASPVSEIEYASTERALGRTFARDHSAMNSCAPNGADFTGTRTRLMVSRRTAASLTSVVRASGFAGQPAAICHFHPS